MVSKAENNKPEGYYSNRDDYIKELHAKIASQEQQIDQLKTEVKNWRIVAEKFAEIYRDVEMPMLITSYSEGVTIDVNNAFIDVTGYKRREIRNKSAAELNIWGDYQDREVLRQEIIKQGYARKRQVSFRRKNGELGQGLISCRLIELNGEKYCVTSAIDLTEEIKLRNSLLQLNEKFSKAFNQNQTMMCISRIADGVYIDVNEKFASVGGYTRDEIVGQSVFKLGLWADLNDRQKMYNNLLADGYIEDWEFDFRTKTGKIGHVMSSMNLIDIDGQEYVLASMVDITKRKETEESLKQSQKLLQQIFNNIPLSIIIASLRDKRIIEVNDRFLSRNNLLREKIAGEKIVYFDDLFDFQEVSDFVMEVLQYGRALNQEVRHHLLTGKQRISLMSGVIVSWEGEECLLAIANDITELRNYQNEMARLDNIKLIGQMAAGMAHEIRNPMTSIRGYLELFKTQERYKDDINALDLMIEEIDRLNEIITAFLSIARQENSHLQPRSLKATILNHLPLVLIDAYTKDITILTELQETSPIMLDEAQIRQMLFNLIRNGMDAMPGGGNILISTYEDANGVNLLIEDQGAGIPSEFIDQIGTPFFTTKDNGTGLGMAICYSIAESHNARIDLQTSAAGTTVKVTFPPVMVRSDPLKSKL